MKRLIVDLDNTISFKEDDYETAHPNVPLIHKLIEYKKKGFEIVIHTSRNMRTYNGNIGKINSNTLPIIITWLEKHNVPFDEIIVAKPWCGNEGFYIDDRAIRPDEFIKYTFNEITELISKK
jgi:capsule biosynthesis phosphatase